MDHARKGFVLDGNNDIFKMLSDPAFIRSLAEGTAAAAGTVAPEINVPIHAIPAPVRLRGTVQIIATFPYESIAGQPYEVLKEKVADTLSGQQSSWLPTIELGSVELWQERIIEDEGRSNVRRSTATADGDGTVRGPRDRNNIQNDWNSFFGDANGHGENEPVRRGSLSDRNDGSRGPSDYGETEEGV